MKTLKLLTLIFLIPLFGNSQELEDYLVYDEKDIEKFLKSTTYVVLDQFEESEFSKALSSAVQEEWKITKFEIIDRGTYREYLKDRTKSFLTREYVAGDKDYVSLVLFMGGQKQMETKGEIMALAHLKHYTATDEEFLYKMPTLIQNIQWQVNMTKNQKFTSAGDFENYYKKQGHMNLHNLNLYILKEHLTNKVESIEILKKFYKHDVSLVDVDVIEDAILTQDSTAAYLSIVAPVKNPGGDPGYFRVYSANGGETLSSYSRSINSTAPLGVTGYDLKRLNK